jgi:tetratricopeptide (TPR) repeat protein
MRHALLFVALAMALQSTAAAAAALPMSRGPELPACFREAENAAPICESPGVTIVAMSIEKPKSIPAMTQIDDSAPCPVEPPFFLPPERAKPALPQCREFVASQPAGSSALATALAKQGLLEFSAGVPDFSAGQREESRATIEKALAIDPDNLTALLAKVELLQILGDSVKARPEIEHLMALYPDEPRVRSVYASLMQWAGSPQEELAALDSTLAIAPDDMNTHRQRADLLARLGRTDEALAELDLMIDTWAEDGYAYFKRAELELDRGHAKAAVDDIEKARALHFHMDQNLVRVRAYLMLGDLEKALEAVNSAQSEFVPQFETPLLAIYHFAILDHLGRKKEAEEALAGLAGERNEHILRIQVFLRNMGFNDVPISGTFDDATKQQLAACLLKGACTDTLSRAI